MMRRDDVCRCLQLDTEQAGDMGMVRMRASVFVRRRPVLVTSRLLLLAGGHSLKKNRRTGAGTRLGK